MANDATMLRIYREDRDIHEATAAIVAGVPLPEFQRWKDDDRLLMDCANEIKGSGDFLRQLNPGKRGEAKVKDLYKKKRQDAKAGRLKPPVEATSASMRIRVRRARAESGDGRFQAGDAHPRSMDLDARRAQLAGIPLGSLSLTSDVWRGQRSRQLVRAKCGECGVEKEYDVGNILAGRTTTCACQRGRKYSHPAARRLAERYHAIVNRCGNPRNPSYRNYGALGIECRFSSAEDFVRYVVQYLPHADYLDIDIDRIDNDGHYAPGNLRLTSRAANLRNTSRNKLYDYRGTLVVAADLYDWIISDHPDFALSRGTTAKLAAKDVSLADILARKPRRRR